MEKDSARTSGDEIDHESTRRCRERELFYRLFGQVNKWVVVFLDLVSMRDL
jgi:hypothetical protein